MARRRNIYDASYQTPLADFLDQLPDYFLRYEQLKQAEADRADQRAFRDKQYANQLNQQELNNQYRNEQAIKQERNTIFNNHTKLMQGMPDYQKAQYIENVLQKDPMLKDYMDFSQFENFSKNIKDANTEYDNINANVDDFRGSSTLSMFSRYSEVADAYEQLQNMEKSVRGTDLELSHAKDLKYVGDLKKELETLSGKEMAEKDMPPTLQEQFNSLIKTNDADYKAMVEAQDELAQYAVLDKQGKWIQRLPNEGEMESSIRMGFSKAKLAYDNSLNRFQASKLQRNTFTKQQGLFYPEIQTAEQLKESDRQSEARTSWFNENESYINQDPESAELALQYLDDPTNADRFSALQEAVSNRRSYEDWNRQMEEELELVLAEDDSPEDIIKKETKPTKTKDITDEEVDAVLADVRETTGFYPEGDAPKDEPQIPAVLEPLTARGDAEKETVVKQKEEEAEGAQLFDKPLAETKAYNVSDIAKSGSETGKVRRYSGKEFGDNLKQLVALRKRLPGLKKQGNAFNIKQLDKKISTVENKIRESIGDYIHPDTGKFSNEKDSERIYKILKNRFFPDLQMREIMDLVRSFSTASPAFSKKDKKAFTSS